MGYTLHGIKYPELTDLPNVPNDIGGAAKMDATTQAWLAALDTANLAKLSAMNSRCASTEASITALSNSIATAVTRQAGQQSSVNAITTRNNNVATRLNARDATLATLQSGTNGMPGQITSLNTQRGRGLIAYQSLDTFTNVPRGSGTNPFASITFNDPAPSAARMYRGFMSVTLQVPDSSSPAVSNAIGLGVGNGTTWPGSLASFVIQTYDGTNSTITVFVDYVFTGMTASQWSMWAAITANTSYDIQIGAAIGDFMTLEDIGVQL